MAPKPDHPHSTKLPKPAIKATKRAELAEVCGARKNLQLQLPKKKKFESSDSSDSSEDNSTPDDNSDGEKSVEPQMEREHTEDLRIPQELKWTWIPIKLGSKGLCAFLAVLASEFQSPKWMFQCL